MREIKVDKNTIRAYFYKIENERKENVHTFIVGKLIPRTRTNLYVHTHCAGVHLFSLQ